ncbi:putative HD superfamily hydrolase [Candidatus Nitrososphaera evergladensis SR1]|jgi:putative hydrolase of HD superfamily|uniref:5'-deoxynucleotidase n=1 Tax=Candidatus Nitrososphaera evergladensis SR1 TaxID=1459636 RepID=A0A075MW43_9ARCH|nr:HD domain-containing protein [Candidatus Nitrososphaera evergladensis]AIF84847.1 putative HD superfamily hydrolase [Candidatus Nitrososphaera evergladensis SR1]
MVKDKDLTPFFDAVIGLKYVRRAGWAAKVGIKDPESVADHSFAMCAVGMALSDILGFDTRKVLKMIVLHDLAESAVGDYMPGEVSIIQKRQEEDGAMQKILACLPAKVRSDYAKIWREYLQDKTKEARFVHRIDKLEMALQAARYAKDGHPEELLAQFFDSAHKAVDIDDDILAEILKSLSPAQRMKNR